MNDKTRDGMEQGETARPEGPGRRLRLRREELGLTVEEAAAQLRLNGRLVNALETDDFDALPPAAFVTGYLRSYARLLQLPADEILETYNRSLQGAGASSLVRSIQHQSQVKSSDLPVRLATYGIVLGLAGLLGAWWYAQHATPPAEQAAIEHPPAVTATAEVATAEPVDETVSLEPEERPVEATPEPEPPKVEPPAVKESETVAAIDPPAPVAPEPKSPEQVTPPAPESEPAPPPLTPAMPQASLELEFGADCWAEIEDAAGRRVLYDLVREGRSVRLQGEAPFKIFLGYAPGVTIYYQGEFFSHERFQRGNVARFRIGQPQDNQPMDQQPTTSDVVSG